MPKVTNPWIDYDSQYYITMTPEHHMRQLGKAYVWEYISTSQISANSSKYVEIITPPASVVHELAWKPSVISCDQLILSEFYEAPTVTDGTTACKISCQSRNNATDSVVQIFSGATAVSGGTLLRSRYAGTGTNAKPVGLGTDSSDLGWHLKPSTKYVIKYTNLGTQTTAFFAVNGQFFEVNRDPKW
jgi:hypothetical protein